MNAIAFLRRLLLLPWAIIQSFALSVNNSCRDIENKFRFPKAKFGKGVCMTPDTVVGESSHILENTILNHVRIGRYSYVSRGSLVQNAVIGNYCSISNDVIIGPGEHPLDQFSTATVFYRKRNTLGIEVVAEDSCFVENREITIGNDVWIGARAIVLNGVCIGDGAVIAAGAVVSKDVPPYCIYGGVPAKYIRKRNTDERVEEFSSTSWWDYSPGDAYQMMNK